MIKEFSLKTSKKQEIVDISSKVERIVKESGIKEGICIIYVPHATAAVIINENYDPNICKDFLDALDKMVPVGVWRHDKIDGNGAAHIKSASVGPSEVILVRTGKLQLGTWQSPMFVEFDGPRQERKVIVQVLGE